MNKEGKVIDVIIKESDIKSVENWVIENWNPALDKKFRHKTDPLPNLYLIPLTDLSQQDLINVKEFQEKINARFNVINENQT